MPQLSPTEHRARFAQIQRGLFYLRTSLGQGAIPPDTATRVVDAILAEFDVVKTAVPEPSSTEHDVADLRAGLAKSETKVAALEQQLARALAATDEGSAVGTVERERLERELNEARVLLAERNAEIQSFGPVRETLERARLDIESQVAKARQFKGERDELQQKLEELQRHDESLRGERDNVCLLYTSPSPRD